MWKLFQPGEGHLCNCEIFANFRLKLYRSASGSDDHILILLGSKLTLLYILYTAKFLGATEKEDIDLLPKRYRPDNLNSLCTATG